MSEINDNTINWLMEGDPSIRWQTMRDLIGSKEVEWKQEQERVGTEGWGAALLGRYARNAKMWGGGLYSPKWTSSTYTLLTLIDIGVSHRHPVAREGATYLVDELFGLEGSKRFDQILKAYDLCIVGMLIRILSYFDIVDSRLNKFIEHLLEFQMPDGGWNCRCKKHRTTHSSLHTTFNALEGLREYMELSHNKYDDRILKAERDALEFILTHKLFKSDKTGRVIKEKFVEFSYPSRWHYDVLRGLDYFQRISFPYDGRLGDALALLESKRTRDGCWALGPKHPGEVFFDMEKGGRPSRWNTLRAMRVLRRYNETQ